MAPLSLALHATRDLCTRVLETPKKIQGTIDDSTILTVLKKNSHLYRYEPTLILKPLVIRFCPLKMFSDSFRSFFTVNNQKLKESENIYKGQKRFTKGFLEKNVVRFARKIENF